MYRLIIMLCVWTGLVVSGQASISAQGKAASEFAGYVKKPSSFTYVKKESVLHGYSMSLSKFKSQPFNVLYVGDESDYGFFQALSGFGKATKKINSRFCSFQNSQSCLGTEDHDFTIMVDAQSSFDQAGLELFLKHFGSLKPGGSYIIEIKDYEKYHQGLAYVSNAILNDDHKNIVQEPAGIWTSLKKLFGLRVSKTHHFTADQRNLLLWVDSIRLVDGLIIIEKKAQAGRYKTSLVSKSSSGLHYQVCSDAVIEYFGRSFSDRLHALHQKMTTDIYDQCDELPEQLMHLKYIRPGDKVLELGANVGRSTLVIANQVGDRGHVTASEINAYDRGELSRLLRSNGLHRRVSIVPAIGKTDFIYRGWESKVWSHGPEVAVPKGWTLSTSIDLPQTHHNVLVADCEGCLWPLLNQYPHLLDGVEKIIIENDASDAVTADLALRFQSNGFKSKLCVPIINSYWNKKSKNSKTCFYQVWSK